jgi:ABC-type ATPase with predicted acetyltransferase domain
VPKESTESKECKPAQTVRVNSKIQTPQPIRGQALEVAKLFGLPIGSENSSNSPAHSQPLYDQFALTLRPGQITAVIGPSGAGKSVLLQLAAQRLRNVHWLDLKHLAKSSLPPVALLPGPRLKEKLAMLSRCGLAEATVLITPAKYLSGGQLYRLALARALYQAFATGRPGVVIADEFAACLDAVTAENLCRQIRKLISGMKVSLLLASANPVLASLIRADQVVVKPLGQPPILLQPGATSHLKTKSQANSQQGLPGDWPIHRGRIGDYRALAVYHYIAGPPACHKRVYVIRPPGCDFPQDASQSVGHNLDLSEFLDDPSRLDLIAQPGVAAVLVVSPPLSCVRGRNIVTANRYALRDRLKAMRLLNAEMECISRVIVHPLYRGLGLAVALVRHALATAQTPYMEALAVMGQVNPFFQRAGMQAYLPDGRGPGRPYVYYFAATGQASSSANSLIQTVA